MRNSLSDGAAGAAASGSVTDAAPPGALARLDRLPDQEVSAVEAVVDGTPASLLLLRDGDGARAWHNVCPHAGRPLDWAPGQFLRTKDRHLVCAAHGATFELGEGRCIAGPCRGDALRPVAVAVRDGAVWLAPDGAS